MDYTVTSPAQLGQVLQGCRKQHDLTQRELGAKVGLLQKTVSMLETDPSRASVQRLFELLSALELQVVLRDKRVEQSAPARSRRKATTEW